MYLYPHIAADLHKYRTTEMQKAAERARLVAHLVPKTYFDSLRLYLARLARIATRHVEQPA